MQVRKETIIIIAVGIVLVLGVAIYRFGPDLSTLAMDDNISLERTKLGKYQELIQEKSTLDRQLIVLNRALEKAESGLLAGETSALAGVDIQNALNAIASRSDVAIDSIRVLPKRETGDDADPIAEQYPAIRVEALFKADISQLKEVLHGIETSPTLLRVIESRCRIAGAGTSETIRVTLMIEGYMKTKIPPENA